MSTGIPTFAATSSRELDEALNQFRQDVFIPWGLSKPQRMSMFQARHVRRLQEEPVTVKISESETYTLRPMRLNMLPGRKFAHKVFGMMKETADFKNLVPFTSGLKMANIRVTPGRWEALIRHTAAAGKLPIILECARQAGRTGLLLRNKMLVRRFYFELHRMALNADFEKLKVNKALQMGKEAVEIMDADLPDHAYDSPAQNPKCDPGVIAILLELSSARALNDFDGVDQTEEVVGYAQKLVANLPEGHFKDTPTPESDRQSAAAWMKEAIMVYSGLERSLSVQDVARDKKLQNALTSRLAEVKEALEAVLGDRSLKRFHTNTWRMARDMLHLPDVESDMTQEESGAPDVKS